MAFDPDMWRDVYRVEHMPPFPCPQCKGGILAVDADTLRMEEPHYSKQLRKEDENWEPDWIVKRFVLFLRCQNSGCGEIVTVQGETTFVEAYAEEDGYPHMETALKPKSMFPAPMLFKLPNEAPSELVDAITRSSELFWMDVGSSANALRISVEVLLDHLKIPRQTTSKTGKVVDLDLNGRIQHFGKLSPEHADTLHALRVVGNLGSHGEKVTRQVFLDACTIYDDALPDIITGKRAMIAALKKKILSTKGKY